MRSSRSASMQSPTTKGIYDVTECTYAVCVNCGKRMARSLAASASNTASCDVLHCAVAVVAISMEWIRLSTWWSSSTSVTPSWQVSKKKAKAAPTTIEQLTHKLKRRPHEYLKPSTYRTSSQGSTYHSRAPLSQARSCAWRVHARRLGGLCCTAT